MTDPAAHLDSLPDSAARAALLRCCGSRAWVDAMMQHRPFRTDASLLNAADQSWNALARADWLEAFAAHPRIGERPAVSHAETAAWARAEQSGMAAAAAETARALAEANGRYETKFGHVFLIRATGKSAEEMLRSLNERLNNDADTELRIAAEQQLLITHLRFNKLTQP